MAAPANSISSVIRSTADANRTRPSRVSTLSASCSVDRSCNDIRLPTSAASTVDRVM